jgi:hypothetical protein
MRTTSYRGVLAQLLLPFKRNNKFHFIVANADVAVNTTGMFSIATDEQQWAHFSQMLSYNILRML